MPSLLKCKVLALACPCCRRAHYYSDSASSHTCMPTCVRRRQPPCPPQQLPLPQQRAQARLPWAATRQSAATPPLPRGERPARSKMGEAKEEKVDFFSLPSVPPIVRRVLTRTCSNMSFWSAGLSRDCAGRGATQCGRGRRARACQIAVPPTPLRSYGVLKGEVEVRIAERLIVLRVQRGDVGVLERLVHRDLMWGERARARERCAGQAGHASL